MYLLDTQIFQDLVRGDSSDAGCRAVRDFIGLAEQRRQRVGASVISAAILRYEISLEDPGPYRANWERRLDFALNNFVRAGALYEVDARTAEAWASLKALPLTDDDGDDLGDDERLVIATAAAHGLRLVSRDQGALQPVVDALGLAIENV